MSEDEQFAAAIRASQEDQKERDEQAALIQGAIRESLTGQQQREEQSRAREEKAQRADTERALEKQAAVLREAEYLRNMRNAKHQPHSIFHSVQPKTATQLEDQQLAAALAESEKSFMQAQADILQPGMHKRIIFSGPENATNRSVILESYKVYQIALSNPQSQENLTCGPRDLFVANAIGILKRRGTPISSKNIDSLLNFNPLYRRSLEVCEETEEQLYADRFPAFIDHNYLHLQQYYVIGRTVHTRTGESAIRSYLPAVEPDALKAQLEIIGKQLSNNRIHHPLHFFCNDSTKKHWFLISIIKYPNTNPIMYYFDSKNIDVSAYPVAHIFIKYLATNLALPKE